MSTEMKNAIVVGGGLCGLFSSILLADKFKKVYIVEFDEKCGGLLKSVKDDLGTFYDQGTHIPNTTMVPEIDDILFGPEEKRHESWHELGVLKTGNYFVGEWDLSTQVVDTRKLPQEIYEKGMMELLNRVQLSEAKDILTYLTETLGPTFTNHISAPLCRKIYGQEVEVSKLMTQSSVNYFGLSRVIGLDPTVTNKLKEIPAFDEKLGYHHIQDFQNRIKNDGIKECIYYYPKNDKGIQFWVDHLISQAKAKGVIFLNKESVSKITHKNNHIESVTLTNSKEILCCDFLYWSAPLPIALKAAGLEVETGNIEFKTANIFHFTFDKPIQNIESYYLWNWDLSAKSFRVTLYPNLCSADSRTPTHKLSIEALSSSSNSTDITTEMMLKELKDMALITKDAKVISSLRQTIHNTFPIPTFEFNQLTINNYQRLNNHFDNIMISGRFSGKQWFHGDIIKSSYQNICEYFKY